MKALPILLFIFSLAAGVSAQKKELLTDQSAVVKRAAQELDAMMANPESDLRIFAGSNHISGEFTYDITIHGKGDVQTVFVPKSNTGKIAEQNLLKDKILTLKFGFKMPKGNSYKFQYTFNF